MRNRKQKSYDHRSPVMESQGVLGWLYEHGIKHNFNDLCSGIEAEFKRRSRQPEIPQFGVLLSIRRLQIILREGKIVTKTNLEALLQLLYDIINFEPFQQYINFHKAVIKLWIEVKLCLVDEEDFHHDASQKHLPCFSWESLKCFRYQVDDLIDSTSKAVLINLHGDAYEELCAKFMEAAHKVIEASFDQQTKRPSRLEPRLRLALKCHLQVDLVKLREVLVGVIPTTALEQLINNEELQETLARQGGPEFEILTKFIRKDITESVLTEILQALSKITLTQISLHATTSQKSKILSEKTAVNIGCNEENLALKELKQACMKAGGTLLKRKDICTSHESGNGKSPQNICKVNEEERKISAKHKNISGLCDTEVNARKRPASPEDTYIITHNSRRIEIVKKVVPVLIKKPSKHFQHPKTSLSKKFDLNKGSIEHKNIQELEKMITTLEDFLTTLKEKLQQEKEKFAAGLQRFRDEHSNFSEDEDDLDHCQVRSSPLQQLTLQISQVQDGHHTQNCTTDKEHSTKYSRNYRNSPSKISQSKKHSTACVSGSPQSCQDKSQGNKNSDPMCASLLSHQKSTHMPTLTYDSDLDAHQLCLSDSNKTASHFKSEEIPINGSQDKGSHQQETVKKIGDKENVRPQPTSHSQECDITESSITPEAHLCPNINLECSHVASGQDYISSRKHDTVSETCKSVLPSEINEISSTVNKVTAETSSCSIPISPKQSMLQSRKRASKRKLKEEKVEFMNVPLYDSDRALLKTRSHLWVSRPSKKRSKISEVRDSFRQNLKELDRDLPCLISPTSSVNPSDDELFLTPGCSPSLLEKSIDMSDTESWISAKSSLTQ